MSFMSVPALDRLLLEPDAGATSTQKSRTQSSSGMDKESVLVRNRSMPLYPSYPYSSLPTPPPPRPRTPSPSSFSPSPYVLNFKRRVSGSSSNGKAVAGSSQTTPTTTTVASQSSSRAHEGSSSSQATSEAVSDPHHLESSASTMPAQKKFPVNGKATLNEDGMLPVREVRDRLRAAGKLHDMHQRDRPESNGKKVDELILKAEAGCEGPRKEEPEKVPWGRTSSSGRRMTQQDSGFSCTSLSTAEEFFDAAEAPLDDYTSDEEGLRSGQRSARSSSSARGDSDSNLEWQLDQEIKRRIAAEDAMAALQQQRNEMACHLAFVDGGGSRLIDDERDVWDAAYQAQKMDVARAVAASIARGAARAEAEEELESVVADKNREVARLRDKLQYFELVNHEMSQRNQEAIEIARRQRHRRRSRNRWLMGCAGAAVCAGVAAALVYRFVPWASLRVRAATALQRHDWKESYPPPTQS